MLILIPSLILFLASFALMVLRALRPNFRFGWLTAVGASVLALLIVIFWQGRMPLELSLPPWKPVGLFGEAPSFRGDSLSWLYVMSLTVLNLSILLTAVSRPQYATSFAWPGILAVTGLGLMAVTANNPLTLLLVWAALDITELVSQLLSVEGPSASERVVISFSTRAFGIGLLLWADITSASTGSHLSFTSITEQAGLYFAAAAGLRLGVFPLHLPYSADSGLRRGFGTLLRLVSATSSLVLLSHIPAESTNSMVTPILLVLTVIAAIYGGWTWLRAPDELTGRPFWIIGLAALSVASALIGNPTGSVAWGCALILTGSLLFLSSTQHIWLNRAILLGTWTLSSLPFSLTASAWASPDNRLFIPFFVIAQALLIAGFVRHATRPGGRDSLEGQPTWTRNVYPTGIVLLLLTQFLAGFLGWDGAMKTGFWPAGLAASLLTLGLIWATPRLRLLNPIRAHWVRPASSGLNASYRALWSIYQSLGRASEAITTTLEGASGLMWTLLFLVLFVSLMSQGTP